MALIKWFSKHKIMALSQLASVLVPHGAAILQYADDTILCMSCDLEKALKVKLLLYFFKMTLGLKINFLKSEVLCIGEDKNVTKTYSELFYCYVGQFPMRYLDVPRALLV